MNHFRALGDALLALTRLTKLHLEISHLGGGFMGVHEDWDWDDIAWNVCQLRQLRWRPAVPSPALGPPLTKWPRCWMAHWQVNAVECIRIGAALPQPSSDVPREALSNTPPDIPCMRLAAC